MDMPFELSPIDCVAKAILLLAQSPRECVVFHPYNNHALLMNDLYSEVNRQGLTVKPAENSEYETVLRKTESDPENSPVPWTEYQMIRYYEVYRSERVKGTATKRSVGYAVIEEISYTAMRWLEEHR